MTPCLTIFTFKSVEQILGTGGSGSWRLNRKRAKRCEYAVLCRNQHNKAAPRSNPELHGAGFMVGRIADVVQSTWRKERSEVLFDEYAMIAMPNLWENRSPVQYKSLEDLGIDPATLDWQPMPEAKVEEAARATSADKAQITPR